MKKIILLFSIVISVVAKAQTKTIVHFDSNKTDLKTASILSLDSLIYFLKDKNDFYIVINGYCDNTGIERFNQILSDFRVEAVFDYFKNKNLNGHFSFKGYSSSNPIADNTSENGKAKNRRVEILITIPEIAPPIATKVMEQEVIIPPISTNHVKAKILDDSSKVEDLAVGKILVLKNLNFVGGTAQLLKESEPSLKLLLKILKENTTMEIEIEGHVCCANDMALSVDRALVVLEYLVKNGIEEKRLKYAGHSWNNPVASEETEFGRQQNRRVEIMILKK
ncbi:OmpA family protein [soil metagenome]